MAPPATSSSPSPRRPWKRRCKRSCKNSARRSEARRHDMKMDNINTLAPAGASPEVFQQLGQITRQLHDTLAQLGVMPRLQEAANGLPDARSRLTYIAQKTREAANRVLNSVDKAKAEHQSISDQTRAMAAAIVADPVKAVAGGGAMTLVTDVGAGTGRIAAHLPD